ncbi:hypothetical protein RUM43_012869, partial [Polyplax serrata]
PYKFPRAISFLSIPSLLTPQSRHYVDGNRSANASGHMPWITTALTLRDPEIMDTFGWFDYHIVLPLD